MQSLKVGNALACEHIVEGLNGKHTLINTYTGDIFASEFPARIPVSFYIEVTAKHPYIGRLDISLQLGRSEILQGGAEVALEAGRAAVIIVPTGFLQIDEPSKMKMMIGIPGEKMIKATETTIGQMPVTVAAPTP